MPAFNPLGLSRDRKQLLARFWQSAFQSWRDRMARAVGLGVFLICIALLQLVLQFLLNLWNRNFFDALEHKDPHATWAQAQIFVVLAAASILVAATSVWARMTAQRSWREALTQHVLKAWLDKDRSLHLNHLAKGSENPEYRIAVDIRIATDAPIDLSLAFVSSVLTAITFFGVLWTTGGSIDVPLFGTTVTIPGYLTFGVILYSGLVSTCMAIFGKYLTGVIERSNQAEAEFRAAVDDFCGATEHGGPVPNGGKRQELQVKLQAVLLWWRELCWQLVRTTLVSQGNTLFASVVGWMLCVPKYLSGAMSLGELTQSAAAFVVVQGAFNWLVDNYQRLADWRSSAQRVATLLLALDELEAKEREAAGAPQA